MDGCWSKNNGGGGREEKKMEYFSEKGYKSLLRRVYVKLVEKGLGDGVYVMVGGGGVCGENMKVGDEYEGYVKKVWNVFGWN